MESIDPSLPYGSYQVRSRERQGLIDNPAVSCPIKPCTVTFDELNDWIPVDETLGEPDPIEHIEVLDQARAHGILGPWVSNELSSRGSTPGGSAGEWNHWLSYIVLGNVFILSMYRASGYYGSQIAQSFVRETTPCPHTKTYFRDGHCE
jgi:hypothetical protein